jgi:hypothetical protein
MEKGFEKGEWMAKIEVEGWREMGFFSSDEWLMGESGAG